ncbi:hypothetical protein BDW69DRAFT_114808 [Aspergillus filifer]
MLFLPTQTSSCLQLHILISFLPLTTLPLLIPLSLGAFPHNFSTCNLTFRIRTSSIIGTAVDVS